RKRGLEMSKVLPFELHATVVEQTRTMPCRFDVVPVAVVFREPSEALIRIEKQVLPPVVTDSLDFDEAAEKSDELELAIRKSASSPKGNGRRQFRLGCKGA